MMTVFIIFSHVIPVILGFLSILLVASGIMDNQKVLTIGGVILFMIAGLSPFVILPAMI